MMRKKLSSFLLSGLLVLVLSGCGYEGFYRYPCQEPENWEKAECKPPVCKVSGTCTTDILGFDPSETTTPSEDTITPTTEGE